MHTLLCCLILFIITATILVRDTSLLESPTSAVQEDETNSCKTHTYATSKTITTNKLVLLKFVSQLLSCNVMVVLRHLSASPPQKKTKNLACTTQSPSNHPCKKNTMWIASLFSACGIWLLCIVIVVIAPTFATYEVRIPPLGRVCTPSDSFVVVVAANPSTNLVSRSTPGRDGSLDRV